MKYIPLLLAGIILLFPTAGEARAQSPDVAPVRMAVARLTHGHVNWVFNRPAHAGIDLVGIYEPNADLVRRFTDRFDLDPALFFSDLDEMLETVRPEAVAAFGSIFEHLEVVEAAAPRGIHVMVEKPLAVGMDHALAMQALAQEHGIHLLTNYETTWYATTHAAYDVVHQGRLGEIRKIIVRDGHRGPQEIGVSDEFLEWLTDPVLNGGGALIDFGCYGANLITWLMNGAEPLTVTAVTQQIKPDVYPLVDDEATIILTYPDAQGIIQASWNWPFDRKDKHVYGQTGYVHAVDARRLRMRESRQAPETEETLEPRPAPFDDPFTYLAAVVRGDVEVKDTDLSSLRNNVTVVKILDAARRSAQTSQTVRLAE